VQIWNKSCYSCHVSQEQKNFDPQKTHTRRPGSISASIASAATARAPSMRPSTASRTIRANPEHDVVVQTRLNAARNTAVCAQCHSFRDILVDGFAAGDDYYDHFLPILEFSLAPGEDPAYWPDGRPRRFSTDAYGFWQSECYLKGNATCLDCHVVPHNTDVDKNPQLKPDVNTLCTRCHQAEGASLLSHTHHAEKSAGSSCVECHMPRTVYSIKAEIRDHAMTIPVPENTLAHAIPNACNVCHKDRDANWALERMNAWYGSASRQKLIRRADAFADARKGEADAIPKLLAILNEPAEGRIGARQRRRLPGQFSAGPRGHARPSAIAERSRAAGARHRGARA
jgi:predicted CXXCH cytochrome family protein